MKAPITELSKAEQLREIQKRTEMLIRVRDRSEFELKDRLARVGFDSALIEHELARTQASGLVDNERFTRLFISGKKKCGWGQIRIENELKRFGIELHTLDGYPEEFFEYEEELDRAESLLQNFRTTAKDKYAACYRKLQAKGFSSEIISKAMTSNSKSYR